MMNELPTVFMVAIVIVPYLVANLRGERSL